MLSRSLPPGRARPAVSFGALVGVFAVAVLDKLTGPELAFSVLYALPVALATWFGGKWPGLLASLLASICWSVVDVQDHAYSHPLIHVWNGLVRASLFLLISLLLSRVRGLVLQLRQLAATDPLTGLANARAFRDSLRAEILRSRRNGRPFGLVYIDLDNFKRLNDQAGHAAGDRLLKQVARVLRNRTRETDVCARLGGDEFALLLVESDAVGNQRLLENLQGLLRDSMSRAATGVSASVGGITWQSPPHSAREAIEACDQLMYAVKRDGKDNFRLEVRGERGVAEKPAWASGIQTGA